MAGPSLGAPSPTSSRATLGATHRNVLSGLQFRKSCDDPRKHAQLRAPDGWRATGWVNRDLDAHPFEPVGVEPPAPLHNLAPIVTRTRREFGGVLLETGHTVTIAASRRARECVGVNLVASCADGTDALRGLLTPPEARILARALIEAAAAVDQAQRQPVFTRGGADHV
jgi:hypothetical protein